MSMAVDREQKAESLRQLADLGLERRIEITTVDTHKDTFARFTENDLQALRRSVQTRHSSQLQQEKKPLLDAWSNFHQEVKDQEGDFSDEPQLMNGQSHRARLHFDFHSQRNLSGPILNTHSNVSHPQKRKGIDSAPHVDVSSRQVSGNKSRRIETKVRHLDPALSPNALDGQQPGRSSHGVSKTQAFDKKGAHHSRSKALKVQRRPIQKTTTVELTDPSTWLNYVRNNENQPIISSQNPDSTSKTKSNADGDSKTIKSVQPPATTKPTGSILAGLDAKVIENDPKLAELVSTAQSKKAIKTSPMKLEPAHAITKKRSDISSRDLSSNANIQPITQLKPPVEGTLQKVASIENPAPKSAKLSSNTNDSSNHKAESQKAKAVQPISALKAAKPIERLVDHRLSTNVTPSRTPRTVAKLDDQLRGSNLPQPQPNILSSRKQARPISNSQPLLIFDQDDDHDSDSSGMTGTGSTINWIQELGFINDALAALDLNATETPQAKQMEERRRILQQKIRTTSQRKNSQAPRTAAIEKTQLIELSPTPASKIVKTQAPVLSASPAARKTSAVITAGLQASRWAISTNDSSTKLSMRTQNTSDNLGDYWQKALSKLRPLPEQFKPYEGSPSPALKSENKVTKSMYESRYAC